MCPLAPLSLHLILFPFRFSLRIFWSHLSPKSCPMFIVLSNCCLCLIMIFNKSGACISPRCRLPLCCLPYSIKSLNSVQYYKNCDLNQNISAGIAGFWHCQTNEIEEDVLSFSEILIELCGCALYEVVVFLVLFVVHAQYAQHCCWRYIKANDFTV
jgi:hypothetical protein